MEYTPDNWIIIKIVTREEVLYKVLAGWSGGYLDGDYWRLNSGIVKIKADSDYYYFHGHSGSIYKCFKKVEFTRMNNAGVLESLKRQAAESDHVDIEEILAEDIDMEVHYE